MNRKNAYIVLSVFIFSIIVCSIDAFIHPNYFAKIPIKLACFFIPPLLFFISDKSERASFLKLFVMKKKGLLTALLLGICVYAVIIAGYFLTRGIIDYSNVTSSLASGAGVTAENFIYVSIYISFMNSFLEEFFFRGYGFTTLKKHTGRRLAYIFSSLIFAAYHVGMLIGMFNAGALALLLFGLTAGGCIFNRLNEASDSIYPSWFVHMFANFAINTVGFILFGAI